MHISHRQLFLQHVAQTSPSALMLEIDRAEGLYLYTKDGKRYMDMISGIAVSALGHSHPEIVKAVQYQSGKYMHVMVYGEYVLSPQVMLARKLTSTLPVDLNQVYFTSTGTEATEAALKLAKRYTGKHKIVSCRDSYHGSTQGALSVMGSEYYKQAYRPLIPGVEFIDFGDEQQLTAIDKHTAAIIIETIQGEAGVRQASPAYFQKLRQRCDHFGALWIADEIQSGMGRSGKMWAFDHLGVSPHIVLTAKSLGGGMPLGACIASKEILSSFQHNPVLGHISTFGGHAVSCAAGLAMLQVLEKEKHINSVKSKEILFKSLLQHEIIKEIRSCGLMLAIDVGDFNVVMQIIQHAMQYGLITDWFLHNNNSLRLAPPLNISTDEISEACAILHRAMDRTLKDRKHS